VPSVTPRGGGAKRSNLQASSLSKRPESKNMAIVGVNIPRANTSMNLGQRMNPVAPVVTDGR